MLNGVDLSCVGGLLHVSRRQVQRRRLLVFGVVAAAGCFLSHVTGGQDKKWVSAVVRVLRFWVKVLRRGHFKGRYLSRDVLLACTLCLRTLIELKTPVRFALPSLYPATRRNGTALTLFHGVTRPLSPVYGPHRFIFAYWCWLVASLSQAYTVLSENECRLAWRVRQPSALLTTFVDV